jgi:hypothetical protein
MIHEIATSTKPVEVPTLLVIGRKEYVAFPDWNVHRLRAKVDTGAFSSALDVAAYDLHRDETGRLIARLSLCLSRRDPSRQRIVFAPVVKMVCVTNSSGIREERPLLETTIRLGSVEKLIRMTVTNRSCMRCRMLLGREALAGSFVVDVSKKYLLRSDHPEQRA